MNMNKFKMDKLLSISSLVLLACTIANCQNKMKQVDGDSELNTVSHDMDILDFDTDTPMTFHETSPASSTTATTETTTMSTTYLPPLPDVDFQSLAGKADDIFILDRSESVGNLTYRRERNLFKDIVSKSLLFEQNQNRIAVITFAGNVMVPVDYISTSDQPSICEFFATDGVYQREVVYDRTMMNGENIEGALEKAEQIILAGERLRPEASRRVWIMSDLENFAEPETIGPLSRLKNKGVTIFGIGIGNYLRVEQEEKFMKYTTTERHYSRDTQWIRLLSEAEDVARNETWVNVNDKALCGSDSECLEDAEYICQCRGNAYRSELRCHEFDDDDDLEEFNMMMIVIGAAAGAALILTIVVIIAIVCCVKRNKTPKEKPIPPPSTGELRRRGLWQQASSSTVNSDSTNITTCNSERGNTGVHASPVPPGLQNARFNAIASITPTVPGKSPSLPPRKHNFHQHDYENAVVKEILDGHLPPSGVDPDYIEPLAVVFDPVTIPRANIPKQQPNYTSLDRQAPNHGRSINDTYVDMTGAQNETSNQGNTMTNEFMNSINRFRKRISGSFSAIRAKFDRSVSNVDSEKMSDTGSTASTSRALGAKRKILKTSNTPVKMRFSRKGKSKQMVKKDELSVSGNSDSQHKNERPESVRKIGDEKFSDLKNMFEANQSDSNIGPAEEVRPTHKRTHSGLDLM